MLSKAEVQDTNLFPNGAFSRIYCTDFALANGISQATSTETAGEIWIRTPLSEKNVCRPDGNAFFPSNIKNDYMGFMPALCLNN